MEIAIAKLEVDEVMQKIDTILKKMLDQINNFSMVQIKEMLTKLRSQTAPEEEGGGTRVSVRFSIIVPKGGLDFSDQIAEMAAPPAPPIGGMSSPPPVTSPTVEKRKIFSRF